MGHKLLIVFGFTASLHAAVDFSKLDHLIEVIKAPRQGLSQEEITTISDPFWRIPPKAVQKKKIKKKVQIYKKRAPKKIVFRLYALFDNRAKINNRWYTKGAKIGNYRLIRIDPLKKMVVLRYKHHEIRLFLPRTKKLIK